MALETSKSEIRGRDKSLEGGGGEEEEDIIYCCKK
jgi:hypothetical protein